MFLYKRIPADERALKQGVFDPRSLIKNTVPNDGIPNLAAGRDGHVRPNDRALYLYAGVNVDRRHDYAILPVGLLTIIKTVVK